MILKRRIKEAESTGNIEIKLEQAEDLKDQLDDLISTIKKEKDPIDKEVNALKEELDEKKKTNLRHKRCNFNLIKVMSA